MTRNYKSINRVLNVSLALASILLAIGLVRVTLAGLHAVQRNPASLVGTQLRAPALDTGRERQVIVVLSVTCSFCSAEAPFYRLLSERARTSRTALVFVVPQSVDDGRKYLDSLGVNGVDIRSIDLSTLGVWGTPTILLVDRNLSVTKVWPGRVPEGEWPAVLGAL